MGLGSADTKLDQAGQVLRLDQLSMLVAGQRIKHGSHEAAGIVRVRLHVAHHHLHGDVGSRLVPAVVVGRHADHLVGDLGFAGKLGFGQGGHVDHAAAPGAVHLALGASGELGAL